jgi:hypothetical protein
MRDTTEQDHFDRAREYYESATREVGIRFPSPVLGHPANKYRRKSLSALSHATLQNHELGKIDFNTLPSDSLDVIEPQVLAAAKTERMNPRNVPPGQLKPIKVLDPYGRVQETKFVGGIDPKYGEQHSFIKDLTRAGRRVVAFMKPHDTIQTFHSHREIA